MSLQTFRHYTICQDQQGSTVEVWRSAEEVACLAFDNRTSLFVELHVSIGPAEGQWDAAHFQDLINQAVPVRHSQLLGIIEGGEDDGTNYYVSEFLDGERLDTWLARCHALPSWLALLLIRQIMDGLAALASHPRLLAGVEVFHAGLALAGPHPGDLSVKICDLGLADAGPRETSPQFIEARAIRDTGRLMLYMLTGTFHENPDIVSLLRQPQIAPELGFLLTAICNPASPHHPNTMEQLRTLTERCIQELAPGLTACPEFLPVNYRPRLPLANHLPDPATNAGLLSNDYKVDTPPADSADPYRHRAIHQATRRAVNVQVFPSPNLLPATGLFPALEKAWITLGPGLARSKDDQSAKHLLAPLAPPEAEGGLFVEDLPGNYTLETLHQLRQPLEAEEVLLILTQLDAAASAAETLGLPLHWRCPRLVPLQFTGPGGEEALAPASQLAGMPLTAWPPFLLKFRTWPIALNYTQPGRFQLERLLPNDPLLTGNPSIVPAYSGGPPSVRDFALLSTWLLGGTTKVPDNLKSLLYTAASTRGPTLGSRAVFLERMQQRLHNLPSSPIALFPTTVEPLPATTPSSPAPLLVFPRKNPGAPQVPSTPAGDLAPAAVDSALADEPEAPPALGFAEALFGDSPAEPTPPPDQLGWSAFENEADNPTDPASPALIPELERDASYLPAEPERELGFMEATGQTAPRYHPDYDKDYLDDDDESDEEDSPGMSRWALFLVVILISAALAALTAHFSGQAIWLK